MAQGTKGAGRPPPTSSNSTSTTNGLPTTSSSSQPVAVNRKKQKRRQKAAAKAAATQDAPPGTASTHGPAVSAISSSTLHNHHHHTLNADDQDEDEAYDTEDEDHPYPGHHNTTAGALSANGYVLGTVTDANGSKKKAKKKKKGKTVQVSSDHRYSHDSYAAASALQAHRADEKDRIWNTSTQEERERIKEFWQSLGEEDRKSLVKIEKEAVLKKMKEQQKHSCSCSLCGRKRNAIEEELEVLYDAYYDELEQYAYDLGPIVRPGQPLPYDKGLSQHQSRSHPEALTHASQSSRGQIQELPDDAYDDEDYEDEDADYSEEDFDDYSQEDSEVYPPAPQDIFEFGNSLTVKGNVNLY